MSTPSSIDRPKPATAIAKWGAACAQCATAKAKCIRSNPVHGTKCDRLVSFLFFFFFFFLLLIFHFYYHFLPFSLLSFFSFLIQFRLIVGFLLADCAELWSELGHCVSARSTSHACFTLRVLDKRTYKSIIVRCQEKRTIRKIMTNLNTIGVKDWPSLVPFKYTNLEKRDNPNLRKCSGIMTAKAKPALAVTAATLVCVQTN